MGLGNNKTQYAHSLERERQWKRHVHLRSIAAPVLVLQFGIGYDHPFERAKRAAFYCSTYGIEVFAKIPLRYVNKTHAYEIQIYRAFDYPLPRYYFASQTGLETISMR
jgi:hypothetical protein